MQANADESYRGILDLADFVDTNRLVDLASVYRRGESKPRYSNTLDGTGTWTSPPGLVQQGPYGRDAAFDPGVGRLARMGDVQAGVAGPADQVVGKEGIRLGLEVVARKEVLLKKVTQFLEGAAGGIGSQIIGGQAAKDPVLRLCEAQ